MYWNNQIASNPDFYGDQFAGSLGSVAVTYCDVQGGFNGTGNINFNPVLAGEHCGSVASVLVLGSLCIDAGDPDPAFDDGCLPPSLGTTRNDMGAFGGASACDWDCAFLLPTDINQDGTVDVVDLLEVLASWGACSGVCIADINCDGAVDVVDLLQVLSKWGSTCPA